MLSAVRTKGHPPVILSQQGNDYAVYEAKDFTELFNHSIITTLDTNEFIQWYDCELLKGAK